MKIPIAQAIPTPHTIRLSHSIEAVPSAKSCGNLYSLNLFFLYFSFKYLRIGSRTNLFNASTLIAAASLASSPVFTTLSLTLGSNSLKLNHGCVTGSILSSKAYSKNLRKSRSSIKSKSLFFSSKNGLPPNFSHASPPLVQLFNRSES